MRYYQTDLGGLYRGELSIRRVAVLVNHLPPDSATAAAIQRRDRGWGVEAYLLADLFHAMTGKPHPARPGPSAPDSKRKATGDLRTRLLQQRARLSVVQDSPEPTDGEE